MSFKKIFNKKKINLSIIKNILLEKGFTIKKKIIKILETKIKPAVARDGGDIKFIAFKEGIVTVQLQGSCSGCPSSTITLKRGVENLLTHYIPDVKQVESI